jgi:hypothetical protein
MCRQEDSNLRPPPYKGGALSTELCRRHHHLAETSALAGPTGRGAPLCSGDAGLHIRELFGAKDALEVGVGTRENLARDGFVVDVEIGAGERARANARWCIRGRGRAVALFGVVADHLVLLPDGGGRVVSAGYVICKVGPCSGLPVA